MRRTFYLARPCLTKYYLHHDYYYCSQHKEVHGASSTIVDVCSTNKCRHFTACFVFLTDRIPRLIYQPYYVNTRTSQNIPWYYILSIRLVVHIHANTNSRRLPYTHRSKPSSPPPPPLSLSAMSPMTQPRSPCLVVAHLQAELLPDVARIALRAPKREPSPTMIDHVLTCQTLTSTGTPSLPLFGVNFNAFSLFRW